MACVCPAVPWHPPSTGKRSPIILLKNKITEAQASSESACMVIHTFAFRWKPGVTPEQKEKVVTSIRALQGRIPGLLHTWVGTNFSPRSQGYELGGVMQFLDRPSLE